MGLLDRGAHRPIPRVVQNCRQFRRNHRPVSGLEMKMAPVTRVGTDVAEDVAPRAASGVLTDGSLRVMHVVFAFHAGGMELGVLKLVNNLDARRVRSAICSTRPTRELA